MRSPIFLGVVFMALATCNSSQTVESGQPASETDAGASIATFAGGCFWCMEPPFEKLDGVSEVISGYTGGTQVNPTYEEVSSGSTGHFESVRVRYDPTKVSYGILLDVFWRSVNPTDPGGQFADRGTQYRTAIFYHNEEQRRAAQDSKEALDASGRFDKPIVTLLLEAGPFYPAEDYHQDYYLKNPQHYHEYRVGSGREGYLDSVWGDDAPALACTVYPEVSREQAKEQLTKLQYDVTQNGGTEPAFNNEYWDNKHDGIYVDIVSGEPLFSSTHKFASGTGWPSFTQPLVSENVREIRDTSFGMVRTEVRSACADSHLGHVFPDGPAPTGLRYCINSAALRFVSKDSLEQKGYSRFLGLFGK